jgi:hypothetical protein
MVVPSEVSDQLRSIASRIDASRHPSSALVASALRRVLFGLASSRIGMEAEDIQAEVKKLEASLGIVRTETSQYFKVRPTDPPYMRKVDAGGASWVLVSDKPVDDKGAEEWSRLMETTSDGGDQDGEGLYDGEGNPL